MGFLKPDDPRNQPFVFVWLIGGVVLGGSVLQTIAPEFEAIDLGLLFVAAACLTVFGHRMGYGLGYVQGMLDEQAKPKD
jgi:hypothetical protein